MIIDKNKDMTPFASRSAVAERADLYEDERTGSRSSGVRHVFGFVIRTLTSVPSVCLTRNLRVSPGFNFMKG